MSFKRIFRELRDSILTQDLEGKRKHSHPRSHIVPDGASVPSVSVEESQWASLPPELLLNVIQKLEASETSWPGRRNIVTCASVCKSWREITKEIVKTPEKCGRLTFPISLKQPGPRDSPIQCFIKREKSTSTYRLYLGLTPSLSGENGKLLFSARKIRRGTSSQFVISLTVNDFSRRSNSYMGKLRSSFLGTKFTIYDSQPPYDTAIQPNKRSNRPIHSKHASPRVPASNYNIATISYGLNVLRTRGPRRMQCTMDSIPLSSIQEGGFAPTPTSFSLSLENPLSLSSISKSKDTKITQFNSIQGKGVPLILKNKSPRWHEQLQCWCLNFRGRVTVASVKNFQLVAAAQPPHQISPAEQDKVILQFGKIGRDIFTMDYCYPLSAFQAFAICLSTFDTKPACE